MIRYQSRKFLLTLLIVVLLTLTVRAALRGEICRPEE